MEFLFTAVDSISHCVTDSFVPFTLSDLACKQGYYMYIGNDPLIFTYSRYNQFIVSSSFFRPSTLSDLRRDTLQQVRLPAT